MRFPVLTKAVALIAVLLALMMALASVTGIVRERGGRLQEAERSVAESLAGSQALLGPVLQRTCTESWEALQGEGKERKLVTEQREFTLRSLPQTLDIQAGATIAPRYRGIFKVNSYALNTKLQASWAQLAALKPRAEHAGSRLQCAPPQVFIAVGDARGIRMASVALNGAELAVQPGTRHDRHGRGFHAELPEGLVEAGTAVTISAALDLVGTGTLAVAPLAELTRLDLKSDWPHPSFGGRFLPTSREVGEQGFSAQWRLSALATTAPQELLAGSPLCHLHEASIVVDKVPCVETFGLSFMDPISVYSLSDRATKYGLLFIALSFVAVGLVEVLKRLRVHPVQYLLVGCALSVFFLLLVSLSEHLTFGWSYLAASAACTLLLGFYGSFVLRGALAGVGFGAGIAALFGTLYVLLQREQTALMLGSLLLFAVLAVIMVATRRIDWYALMTQMREGGQAKDVTPTAT